MEKHENSVSGYNRRCFLKRSLQIGTVFFLISLLSLSLYFIQSVQAKDKKYSRMKSIFDKNDFGRMGAEIWNESGPFGVFLQDDVSYQGVRMGPSSWEDLAFYTWAESNGKTFYIVVGASFVGGEPYIGLRVSHAEIEDKNQVHGDFERLQGSFSEKIKVTLEKDRVVWKSCHAQVISQPPVWHTLGEFEDPTTGIKVKLDLLYKQTSHEFPFYVPSLGPGRRGKGMHAPLTAEGEIYLNDEKYVIENGITTYERCVMPDRGGLMGNMEWINGFCGDDMNFYFTVNDYGASEGFLCVKTSAGRRFINFEDIDITITDTWYDPKVKRDVPSKWDVVMISKQGTFTASLSVFGAELMIAAPERIVYHYSLSIDAQFEMDEETVTATGIGTNECRIVP